MGACTRDDCPVVRQQVRLGHPPPYPAPVD
jgi:hypothetical protein